MTVGPRGTGATGPSGTVAAGLLPRFVARLIDHLLITFGGFVVAALLVLALSAVTDVSDPEGWVRVLIGYVLPAVLVLAGLAYFAGLEVASGQTVGKRVLRLRTTGPDGGTPTLSEALRRNSYVLLALVGVVPGSGRVGDLLSLGAAVAIAVSIALDPGGRQGWHDRLAGGTRVVRLG